MKDSLSYRGASLWYFINYNHKEASATLNFNQLRKLVSAEDYFKNLKFECMSASALKCLHFIADADRILYITDHCVYVIYN